MIRHIVPIILLLFVSCSRSKQIEQKTTADTPGVAKEQAVIEYTPEKPSDLITSIREKVERINTAQLEKKHFEFMCDEKMMVDYFYKDGVIVKIAVDFGTVGDVYAKEGYYYEDGKLIFIYEFVEGGPACEGCIKKDEYRSYIRNNKVIRFMKNTTEEKCGDCEFGASSRQYKLLQAQTPERMKAIICRL